MSTIAQTRPWSRIVDKPTSFATSKTQYDDFHHAAIVQGISAAEFIRQAIHEKLVRDGFIKTETEEAA